MVRKIFLSAASLAIGGIVGFVIGSKVNERRTMDNNFIDISEVEAFCKKHECDTCPLLDTDVDMCKLHTDIPANWDNQMIKEVVR